MEETPKKVLQSDRCFICSIPVQKKEKIYIFGKSSFDFPAIISSCLDVNVSCYSATSELSVCKACYRRLIKFKKASDHLEELKDELRGIFKDRELPRTKRLLNVESEDGETQASYRGKSSKCLQFDLTTCTSKANATANSSISTAISQQVRYYTPARSPIGSIGVSPIASHPYGLVLQAFPSQLTVTPLREIPQPILTSTPIASKAPSNHPTNTSETSKTVLSVQYPSKTFNKTLCGSYQTIGKALAHGVPSQIANAVMKNPTLRNHVVENVLKTLSKEVAALCSKKNPSILRKSGKEDLAKFDLQLLCNEWKERAPLFYSFLMTSAVNKRTKECSWFSSIAIAGSVLLKQRSEKMDATASVLGVLLKSKSVEVSYSSYFLA